MNKKLILISRILFAIYVCFLLYFLLFAESMGRTAKVPEYRYNLELFKEIKRFMEWAKVSDTGYRSMMLNVFGNVVCFIPFGIFVPVLFKNIKNIISVVVLGLFSSIIIELIQLVTKTGSFDVDDIILNTSGVFMGFLLYALVRRWRAAYVSHISKKRI